MKKWEEHQRNEIAFWAKFGSRRISFLVHHDFFELIWRCFCKSLHGKEFGSALEIGIGGSGGFLSVIPHIRYRYGVDDLVDVLMQNKLLPLYTKIRYKKANAEDLPYKDHTFDLAIMANTLDHCDDMAKVVSEIKRVLKPEGYLLFQTYLDVPDPHPHTFKDPLEVKKMIDLKVIEECVVDDNDIYRGRSDYYVGVFQK